ncbi:MAG: 5'-nucleotidase [Burkholderiaceae bacterium]
MPYPIENKLVIAVSSRALFDLEAANAIHETQGVKAYRCHQMERLDQPLAKGVAFPFVRRLLRLNELYPQEQPVEVVVLSRNSPETGQRFFRSCRHYGLAITRGAFLSGQSPYDFLSAYNASLFLSANRDDVIAATQGGLPAGWVLPTRADDDANDHELRIAFDFDGVVADDESERVYAHGQLEAFHAHELARAGAPHSPGPLQELFSKIGRFQQLEAQRASEQPGYRAALRISIVTARSAPAEERLVTTLKNWGMSAAELFLMGGIEKKRVLEVLRPHIFFDDQLGHLEPSSATVPSVLVPFGVKNENTSGQDQ